MYINGFIDISGGRLQTRSVTDGHLLIAGDTSLNGNLYVGGDISWNPTSLANDSIPSSAIIGVVGGSDLDTDVDLSLNKRLFVGSDVSLNGKLYVGGDISWNPNNLADNSIPSSAFIVSEDSNLNKRLFVGEDVSLNRNLFVGEDVILNQSLIVTEDVSMNQTLIAAGDSILGGLVGIGVSSPSCELDISGIMKVSGDISLNSRLFIQNTDILTYIQSLETRIQTLEG
jgi:predicted acyltransferase (DUF342 family)